MRHQFQPDYGANKRDDEENSSEVCRLFKNKNHHQYGANGFNSGPNGISLTYKMTPTYFIEMDFCGVVAVIFRILYIQILRITKYNQNPNIDICSTGFDFGILIPSCTYCDIYSLFRMQN